MGLSLPVHASTLLSHWENWEPKTRLLCLLFVELVLGPSRASSLASRFSQVPRIVGHLDHLIDT